MSSKGTLRKTDGPSPRAALFLALCARRLRCRPTTRTTAARGIAGQQLLGLTFELLAPSRRNAVRAGDFSERRVWRVDDGRLRHEVSVLLWRDAFNERHDRLTHRFFALHASRQVRLGSGAWPGCRCGVGARSFRWWTDVTADAHAR